MEAKATNQDNVPDILPRSAILRLYNTDKPRQPGDDPMPCISRFYGIAIYLYYRDHAPPHFHAIYAEHDAEIEIATGTILDGTLPRKARGLVTEWAELHRQEIQHNWDLARVGKPLIQVEPLE